MPWQKKYDEAAVLDKAMLAFWRRGYEATSMEDLVRATGVNRASIYSAFDSKHGLFMRALRHYDEICRADHLQRIADEFVPKQAIVEIFEQAARQHSKSRLPAGCLLVNSALESAPHDPEVQRLVSASFEAVEDFFRARIEAAQQAGDIDSAVDSRDTAKSLLGLFLGLRVMTRAGMTRSDVDAVVQRARSMLG